MPGRNASSDYRYGFNGMENDDEVKGSSNSVDFGARIYDVRIARWTSLDPLMATYPDLSPYCFVGNSPLLFVDPDGQRLVVYGSHGEWVKFKAVFEAASGGSIRLERDKEGVVSIHRLPAYIDNDGFRVIPTQQFVSASPLLWDVMHDPDNDAVVNLIEGEANDGIILGDWRGSDNLNASPQLISMDDIAKLDGADAISQLGQVMHEVMESYKDAVAGSPAFISKEESDAFFNNIHESAEQDQAGIDGFAKSYARPVALTGLMFGTHFSILSQLDNEKGEYILSVFSIDDKGDITGIRNFKVNEDAIKWNKEENPETIDIDWEIK